MKDGMLAGIPIPEVQSTQEGLVVQAKAAGETLRFDASDNVDGTVDLNFFVVPKVAMQASETLGGLSRRYEVGHRGPEVISTGKGDRGGKSYGCWQMTSQPAGGTVTRFVMEDGFPFAGDFAGLPPGSDGFDAAWRAVAARDAAGFEREQHAYVLRTHYDVALKRIIASGIDAAARVRTLHEVLWSATVQHGAFGALGIFRAAGATDPRDDAALIRAIYAERGRRDDDGVLVHFSGNSKPVQESVAKRFVDECDDALELLAAEAKAPRPAVFAVPAPVEAHEGRSTTGSPGDESPSPQPVMRDVPAWFEIAFREVNQAQLPGPADNARIVEYFGWTSLGESPDSVAWCGAFVSFCLGNAGFLRKGTGSARAANWMDFGKPLEGPRKGCVVVLEPQAPGSSGHVAFWDHTDGERIFLLGGNQGGKVGVNAFALRDVRKFGYRWPLDA
ncbi:TIGR02594 family protein [Plastoroseomonas arctica]|uniref:TIGR02594 family protein n=1 Tax=Plastoroseomonas arctica TaxID=1509237 RepID=A0AAF1JUB6_9PROT|nr:TIGR02594 family protein [Plastoroseomonas arctica]MBR0653845.1 TIGR02594 family protein [Plastoroseomonas arctica]